MVGRVGPGVSFIPAPLAALTNLFLHREPAISDTSSHCTTGASNTLGSFLEA
jgi:hypothetical protein